MFKLFYPCEYVESVFTIDYEKLYNKGYRGLIFDIDNTLVPHGNDSEERVDALFSWLHNLGFQTLLLSNNDEERVKRFLKNISSLYICDAQKPKPENYCKAVEMLDMKKEETVCIGDQVFTDILGANLSGLDSILVRFIGYDTETKIGIRRTVEKLLLKFYSYNKKCQNRLGNIQKRGRSDNAKEEIIL